MYFATGRGQTVVTHEKLITDPNHKKVKIPNICEQFGVDYTDTYSFLRSTGAIFNL